MSMQLTYDILSMDSYCRGYNHYVNDLQITPGTQIGDATIVATSGGINDKSVTDGYFADGFYGVAYSFNNNIVISYRGTDSVLGSDVAGGSDAVYGWTVGAGFPSPQLSDAISFFDAVTGASVGTQLSVTPTATSLSFSGITFVGHSLGGGLAGVMAALTQSHGTHAYVLDNMPYAVAASVAYYLASELDAAPPNASNVTQSYVTGEVLQYIRCESLRPCIGSRRLSKG